MGDEEQSSEQADSPRPGSLFGRLAWVAALAALFTGVALLGTATGVIYAYESDLQEISALDDYRPNTITRLFARDGQVIGEFAVERRLVIGYDEMSPYLRQAIIATEDAEFEQHFGLSVTRIAVTAVRDVLYGQRAGASTITQQLARLLFLPEYMTGGVFERSLERKVKEALVAIQLEKRFTKREILTFYANQINLGHGAYGVEAASRMYFAKASADLTLDEAATIAAIIQTPARLSPFVNPDRTLARRNNYVLQRMAAEGFISADEAQAAAERPLVLRGQPRPERSVAPYFVEDVRKMLEQRYGADALYEGGLEVRTTLDAELQRVANVALDRGLRQIDKRRSGYRRPQRNVLEETPLDEFTDERWSQPIGVGDIVPALVVSVPDAGRTGDASIRIGTTTIDLPRSAFAWTRRTSAANLVRRGDLIEVEVKTLADSRPETVVLEQPPLVEGALIAIDNRTGEVRAMSGGFSFARSKFNRATQARRQMGSLFKAIIYTAAIDRGYTPLSVFIDEPVEYEIGEDQPPYSPLNYDHEFEGPVTLRHALEQSRNIPAVKAMVDVGPDQVVSYAKRFGFPGIDQPYLSLALGSAEATLTDVTSAYSAFPNHGVRMRPYLVVSVTDREGNVLEENRPEPHGAVRADTAYLMTNLLRGVVLRGTAASAASLDWPLAGKTGTMDEYTDAWFVGFDPNITVGVWVGHDEKKPIGRGETGASAALPIWIDFVRGYIDIYGDRTQPPEFEAPENIVFVTLDSGAKEAFINGTQPLPGAPVVPPAQPLAIPLVDPAPLETSPTPDVTPLE